jgi:hypothetical protein
LNDDGTDADQRRERKFALSLALHD